LKPKLLCIVSICLFILLLSGCNGEEKPIFFHVFDDKPKSFPADVKIHYSISDNYTYMIGEKHSIVLHYEEDKFGASYSIYPIEGFKVLNGNYKYYPMNDPSDYGYGNIIALNTQQGSFNMKFNNEEEYDVFTGGYINDSSAPYFKKLNKKP
jgi:hypothetical protein